MLHQTQSLLRKWLSPPHSRSLIMCFHPFSLHLTHSVSLSLSVSVSQTMCVCPITRRTYWIICLNCLMRAAGAQLYLHFGLYLPVSFSLPCTFSHWIFRYSLRKTDPNQKYDDKKNIYGQKHSSTRKKNPNWIYYSAAFHPKAYIQDPSAHAERKKKRKKKRTCFLIRIDNFLVVCKKNGRQRPKRNGNVQNFQRI